MRNRKPPSHVRSLVYFLPLLAASEKPTVIILFQINMITDMIMYDFAWMIATIVTLVAKHLISKCVQGLAKSRAGILLVWLSSVKTTREGREAALPAFRGLSLPAPASSLSSSPPDNAR